MLYTHPTSCINGGILSSALSILFLAALAVEFGFSAYAKFKNRETFGSVLHEYGMRSRRLRRATTFIVPATEGALCVLLLTLQHPWTDVGAWGALGFLIVVTAALAVRAVRGDKRFRCGCGGDLDQTHDAGALILRNAALIFFTAVVIRLAAPLEASVLQRLEVYCCGAVIVMAIRLSATMVSRFRELSEWNTSA